MISELKELAILKKVIRDNLNKIEKTDIYNILKENITEVSN